MSEFDDIKDLGGGSTKEAGGSPAPRRRLSGGSKPNLRK